GARHGLSLRRLGVLLAGGLVLLERLLVVARLEALLGLAHELVEVVGQRRGARERAGGDDGESLKARSHHDTAGDSIMRRERATLDVGSSRESHERAPQGCGWRGREARAEAAGPGEGRPGEGESSAREAGSCPAGFASARGSGVLRETMA